MIANVLILVSLVVILLGILGVKECTIKKRMVALALVTIGGLGIAFCQTEMYGLISGFQQLPFKVFGLLFLWLLVSSICKKNQIVMLEDLNGVRRFAPYTYALITFMAAMLIGVPGTGTFTGILYAQMGYMYGSSGVFAYLGMLSNILAMIISALLVFPILREAFLFEKKDKQVQEKEDTNVKTRKRLEKPSVALQVIAALVAVAMAVLSVWQGALSMIVTKIVESMM